ncbi:MAG: HD domain-containing protein, partial [Candidatus Omnitrophica bacterium]|nr:HD domain-containing protein [Candidatus Omnitrophota bacterium]
MPLAVNNTPTDYKKELEKAAKQMILIHRPDTLVKLILRTILRTLKLEYASIILYDQARDAYVAYVSSGKTGLKVPQGLTKVTKNNPLIRYFTGQTEGAPQKNYLLLSDIISPKDALSRDIKYQFFMYNASACIPGFFREKLILLLFLGGKLNGEDFNADELGFMSALSSDTVMAIQNAWFFQDLNEQLQKNKRLFLQTALALSSAIEAKDHYTQGHTERVTQYALSIALEMKSSGKVPSYKGNLMEDLRLSSLLHDIGKIGVPERILNKNGALNDEEYTEMKKHTIIGANILGRVDEFQEPILGVRYHHERYDGTGYPEGLNGGKIPL